MRFSSFFFPLQTRVIRFNNLRRAKRILAEMRVPFLLYTGTRTVGGETETEGGDPYRYSERPGSGQRLQGNGRSYQIQVDEDGSRAAIRARLEGQS